MIMNVDQYINIVALLLVAIPSVIITRRGHIERKDQYSTQQAELLRSVLNSTYGFYMKQLRAMIAISIGIAATFGIIT